MLRAQGSLLRHDAPARRQRIQRRRRTGGGELRGHPPECLARHQGRVVRMVSSGDDPDSRLRRGRKDSRLDGKADEGGHDSRLRDALEGLLILEARKHPLIRYNTKNIEKLADNEFHVTLRINYTSDNIESCRNILNNLSEFKIDTRHHIVIDFQRVWQDKPNSYEDSTDLIAQQLRTALHSMNFRTANHRLTSSIKSPCYADNINELLVNYNGDIFFCTARDFNSENRAGKLNKDGEIEWIGNSYSQRMSCKFKKDICRSCRIAPICGGGCRTKCLETAHHSNCNLGYSEEDIDNLILDRFIDRYIST